MEIDEDDFYSYEPQVAAQGLLGAAAWLRTNVTTEVMVTILN